jgi:transcriptional regulator with XRE-family HTH domain
VSDGPAAESQDDLEQELGPQRDWMTRKETAAFLGVSESTVERYERAGRLVSMTGKGKMRRFDRRDVATFRAQLRAEKAKLPRGFAPLPEEEAQVMGSEETTGAAPSPGMVRVASQHVASTAVVDLVNGSNSHAEEYGRQLLLGIKTDKKEDRELFDLVLNHYKAEIQRLHSRVDSLEQERKEYQDKLEELRVKEQDDADRAQKRQFLWETVKEVKSLAKSIIATKMRDPANKSAVGVSSLKDLFDTLTDEQMGTLMMGGTWEGLKPEQLAMLQALLASQATEEEKAEAAKETGT